MNSVITENTSFSTNCPHGGKQSFHGIFYHLKVAMLVIVRIFTNDMSISVAAEKEGAGKFDDIVVTESNGVDKNFTFIQVKHCSRENKGSITARNLLTGSKGDFCLPKYLKSYREIRANPMFNGNNKNIKNLVLYTNKNFKYGDCFCNFELREDIFQKAKFSKDRHKKCDVLQTDLLCFKNKFKGRSFLESMLKSAIVEIPKSFAEKVTKGEVFNVDNDLCQEKSTEIYLKVLLNEVINADTQSFRPLFIESKNLSREAMHYRDILKSETFDKHHGDENNFQKELSNYTVNLAMNNNSEAKIDSPSKMAEKLASSMKKNWDRKMIEVTDLKSVFARNLKALAANVFQKNEDGGICFQPQFITGNNLPEDILEFREMLLREMKKRNLKFTNIDQFKFLIKIFEEKSNLPISSIDDMVESFLAKLAFAVEQSDDEELDKNIKEELIKNFELNEVENIYSRFLVNILTWLVDRRDIELSKEVIYGFFEKLKKETFDSVHFQIKHPLPNFTGRKKELQAVHQALQEDTSNHCNSCISQTAVIIGGAGVGKTELTKKYISSHRGEYDNIIWIDAKNNETTKKSFLELGLKMKILGKNCNANSKKLKTIVSRVYELLRGKKTLIIFDGARKLGGKKGNFGIRKFLPNFPSESKHYTLITSRNDSFGDIKQIKLDNFSKEVALSMIRKFISLNSRTKINQAKDLAKTLQNNPLHLQKVLSYIRMGNEKISINDQNYTISDLLQIMNWKQEMIKNHNLPVENASPFLNESASYFKEYEDYAKTRI